MPNSSRKSERRRTRMSLMTPQELDLLEKIKELHSHAVSAAQIGSAAEADTFYAKADTLQRRLDRWVLKRVYQSGQDMKRKRPKETTPRVLENETAQQALAWIKDIGQSLRE